MHERSDPLRMLSGIWAQLILIFILIAVNGLFALSEMALVTVRPTQIAHMIESGTPGADRLRRLTKDSSRFLSTIQVTITLSGFLASASASVTLAGPLAQLLSNLGLPSGWTSAISIFLVTAAVSYLSLILGELVPKQMALRAPGKLALRIAPLIEGLSTLLGPFVRVLSASTAVVLKVLRVAPAEGRTSLSEEELRRLVVEQRTLEEEEKELIDSAFQFGDEAIGDVMVPRADVVAIKATSTVQEAVRTVTETGYSRLPVFGEDLDDIRGIVTAKDLLAAMERGEVETSVEGLCRTPMVVPETKNALALLQEMRYKRVHMAMVVDEYGTIAGIVTIEDLLEEIVGEIQDETDPEHEQRIITEGDNEYVVDAGLHIEDVLERIGIPLGLQELDGTVAGFLLARFQRIPKVGESIEHHGLRFTVEEVRRYRIERVRVVPINPSAERPRTQV